LPEPVFTPAIKNDIGHDENISVARLAALLGAEQAGELERISLALYTFARDEALERGIIIADTKFEFGLHEGSLMLIDEALTPDSSRFWPADRYAPGRAQPSFDKQPVRDYLARCGWDRQSAPPALPAEVVEATVDRYHTALRMLTGHDL
jgi:phosphoribosylaminoimidazole-succinocarboxamide synthase